MSTSKFLIVLGCLGFFLSGSKCVGESFYHLDIENNSNDTIVAFKVHEPGYRDTILPPTKPGNIRFLQPHTRSSFTSQVPYEEIFKKLDRDTMSFYFYKYHIFSTMDWNEVRENRLFLMRYELSLDDMKRLSFSVPYPPNEAMADMKVVLP